MLFYQGVEKQIEQGTVVKLERFIAIKMRPMHKSVKKLADRAKYCAKSIVGWIRTGEKKKREIIERVEKQQRDHFKTKQYKKPKKKTRRRDSTSTVVLSLVRVYLSRKAALFLRS